MPKRALYVTVLVCAAIMYCAGLTPYLPFGDSGHYYLLAQSLSQGSGYTFIGGPHPQADIAYPFMYPVFLIPFVIFAPGNFIAIKLLTILLTLACAVLVYVYMKRFYGDTAAGIGAIGFAFNPFVAFQSRTIGSDIPFILFVLWLMYLIPLYAQEKKILSKNLVWCACLFFLAFYTRIIGFTILIAAACFFTARRQYKKGFVLCAVFSALMSIWVLRYMIIGLPMQYFNEGISGLSGAGAFFSRGFYNLAATVGKEMPDLFFWGLFNSIDPFDPIFIGKLLLGVAIAITVLAGFIKTIRRKGLGFAEWFCLVYFAVGNVFWKYHGSRYLLPLLPMFIYYAFVALRDIAGRRIAAGVLGMCLILSIAGGVREIIRERARHFSPEERSFVLAADWLKRSVDRQSIVLSREARWLFVYAPGLRGAVMLPVKDVAIQLKSINEGNVDYLVIDQNKVFRDDARDFLSPVVQKYPERFSLVYESPQGPITRIYKVNR